MAELPMSRPMRPLLFENRPMRRRSFCCRAKVSLLSDREGCCRLLFRGLLVRLVALRDVFRGAILGEDLFLVGQLETEREDDLALGVHPADLASLDSIYGYC